MSNLAEPALSPFSEGFMPEPSSPNAGETFLAFLTFLDPKNPLFEVISLHGPTGPPIIRVLISVLCIRY